MSGTHKTVNFVSVNSTSLSVVIITFNEEGNIARCINSVKEIADEVLVLDSGSTDNTVKIAGELGARVETHPFDGHIQQKNRALKLATCDLVLSLDADEMPDEKLFHALKEVKHAGKSAGAYSMNRLNRYCGRWLKHGGWYPDRKIRLFKKDTGAWAGINPHDRYEPYPDVRVVHLPGNLLHHTFDSAAEHLKKMIYFADIAAKAYYAKGKKASVLAVMLHPWARFIRDYFLKAGFLDGYQGFQACVIMAMGTFIKYARLRELGFQKTRENQS